VLHVLLCINTAGESEFLTVIASGITALGFVVGSQKAQNPTLKRICQVGTMASIVPGVGVVAYYSTFPGNPALMILKSVQVALSEHFHGRPARYFLYCALRVSFALVKFC
jgi:hypothetical protein